MESSKHPLQKWLDDNLETVHTFSKRTGISHNTIYRILKFMPILRKTAIFIVKETGGKVTLTDLGFD